MLISRKIKRNTSPARLGLLYVKMHTQKSQAAGWNTRNISCLRCGMPNSGKVLLEKAGRIYMLEKNSFICVKSILKNNPCNQLTLRLDLLVRLKGKSKPLCVWVQLVGQYFVHAPCEWPKVPYSRFAHND